MEKECGCGLGHTLLGKPVQYECDCGEDDCTCSIIEFDDIPHHIPYCCGMPMKRVN